MARACGQQRVVDVPVGDLQPPVQQVQPLPLVGEVVDHRRELDRQVAVVVHGVVPGLVQVGGHRRQRGDALRLRLRPLLPLQLTDPVRDVAGMPGPQRAAGPARRAARRRRCAASPAGGTGRRPPAPATARRAGPAAAPDRGGGQPVVARTPSGPAPTGTVRGRRRAARTAAPPRAPAAGTRRRRPRAACGAGPPRCAARRRAGRARAAICAVNSRMPNAGARAAPSSIASGSPSSRRHSSAMASRSSSDGPTSSPCARSRNSRTAGLSRSGPDGSGSGAQLVHVLADDAEPLAAGRQDQQARRRVDQRLHHAAPARPAPTRRCPGRAAPTSRAATRPARPPGSAARGMHDAGRLGQRVDQPVRGDRGEIRPERRRPCPASRCAASSASRVLPTPPGPTSVTTPFRRQTVQRAARSSRSRPTIATRPPRQSGPSAAVRPRRSGASGRGGSGQVVAQDARFQLAQARRRIEAELLGQQPAVVPVGVERVRDPSVGVQGAHEQRDRRSRSGSAATRSRASATASVARPGRSSSSTRSSRAAVRSSSRRTAATWANPLPNSPYAGPRHSASALVQHPRRLSGVGVHQGAGPPVAPLELVGVDRAVRRGEQVAARLGADAARPSAPGGRAAGSPPAARRWPATRAGPRPTARPPAGRSTPASSAAAAARSAAPAAADP